MGCNEGHAWARCREFESDPQQGLFSSFNASQRSLEAQSSFCQLRHQLMFFIHNYLWLRWQKRDLDPIKTRRWKNFSDGWFFLFFRKLKTNIPWQFFLPPTFLFSFRFLERLLLVLSSVSLDLMPPAWGQCYEPCFLVTTDRFYQVVDIQAYYEHIFVCLLENEQENFTGESYKSSK